MKLSEVENILHEYRAMNAMDAEVLVLPWEQYEDLIRDIRESDILIRYRQSDPTAEEPLMVMGTQVMPMPIYEATHGYLVMSRDGLETMTRMAILESIRTR